MTAMPSSKYLRETAKRPGSGPTSVFLTGLEFKKVVALSYLFLMDTFREAYLGGL